METKRPWQELSPEEQLQLREAFGHYLDGLPASCSLQTKIARFQLWLADRGISFEQEDIRS
jgi:hypothetical protein